MAEIIRLQGKRTFTFAEAEKLLPVVKRLTDNAVEATDCLVQEMDLLPKTSHRHQELEAVLNSTIELWVQKIERLGCEAKGLWLVDFDSGAGYYCWQHGEEDISYFHGYQDGFAGRRPLNLHQLP